MIRMLAAALLVVGAATPRVLPAQRILGFGGLEGRTGTAIPKNADVGYNYAFDVDLGYLKLPTLRTYAGFTGFGSDVDLEVGGNDVGGSIKGFGLETGVRMQFLPLRRFSPSVLLGLSFTDVTARDVSDPATSDLLDGFYMAFDYGVGLAWNLGRRHTWALIGDLRNVTGSNVGRTVATVGVRWTPRGRSTWEAQSPAPAEAPVATPATPAPPGAAAAPAAAAAGTAAAAMRQLPGVADVRETDSTVTVVLNESVFDGATGGLSTVGQSTLRSAATSLAAYPNATVRIEGYSDSTGNVVEDQRASDQRAAAVRAGLIAGGVNPARLTSSGYGATRPIGDNATSEGRSKNRRVEIVVGKAKP